MSTKNVEKNENIVKAAFYERRKVSQMLDERAKGIITESLPISLEIWKIIKSEIRRAETATNSPLNLNDGDKYYAMDGILTLKALGLDVKQFKPLVTLYTLAYFEGHLMDDFVEDRSKFNSKFIAPPGINNTQLTLSVPFFPLTFNLAAIEISKTANFTEAEIGYTLSSIDKKLLKMIRCYVKENDNLNPREVLLLKQHKTTGEATTLFSNLLQTKLKFDPQRYACLKKGVSHLGSLTQLTDDIRDYDHDVKVKNANLLASLKGKSESESLRQFASLYSREENRMIYWFKGTKTNPDLDLLKTIPWYPFLLRE